MGDNEYRVQLDELNIIFEMVAIWYPEHMKIIEWDDLQRSGTDKWITFFW